MPPWHADAPPGTFHNERLLSDADRATLVAWANGGAPKGDPAALPPTPTFPEGWSVGKPDVVLEMADAYKLPADGTIEYEYFYIPTNFTEPKWVKSIEIRPGNREVVHHVLVYYRAKPDMARTPVLRPNEKNSATPNRRTRGKSPRRTDLQDLPQRLIASATRPAPPVQIAPAGTAFRLEPGGVFELQMHYTTNGEETTDRTKVGITFSKEPSPREVRAGQFINGVFTLPAGNARRRRDRGRRVPAGHDRVGAAAAHAPARQEVGLQADPAERRDEDHPVGAELRLQLADLLHVQGAAARAEGREDRVDARVRQLRGQQVESRSEGRREVGRPDLGRDAVHGHPLQPRAGPDAGFGQPARER